MHSVHGLQHLVEFIGVEIVITVQKRDILALGVVHTCLPGRVLPSVAFVPEHRDRGLQAFQKCMYFALIEGLRGVVDEDDFHVAVLLIDEGLECTGKQGDRCVVYGNNQAEHGVFHIVLRRIDQLCHCTTFRVVSRLYELIAEDATGGSPSAALFFDDSKRDIGRDCRGKGTAVRRVYQRIQPWPRWAISPSLNGDEGIR